MALQILQNDQQISLHDMYLHKDKDQDNIQMLHSLKVKLDTLLSEDHTRSIKPYFLEAYAQVSLQWFDEYKDIQSKFSDTYVV